MARSSHIALLFPGQGSQTADMREQVERHRPDLLELAEREVSPDLFERADDGTRWAQPAIFCAALAGWEQLREGLEPAFMAGHSLGEITALTAAGALSSEDGLRLVAARGRLMQEAADVTGDGGMTAVRARDDRAVIHDVVEATGVQVANDNAPDQIVLSGSVSALDDAEAQLRERGVRAKRLPVAGAFHSRLMEPAVEPFSRLVSEIEVSEPSLPVYSCVTAEPFDDLRQRLVEALTHPVRWLDAMHSLESRGARQFVETGPGRVLTNLVRKALGESVDAEAPLAKEAARA